MADSTDNDKKITTEVSTEETVVETTTTTTPRGGLGVADVHAVIRENDDPYSRKTGFPISVLALCGLIALAAIVYGFVASGSANRASYAKGEERLAFLPKLTPEQKAAKLAAKGPQLYARCAGCHQPNGKGQGDWPPLAESEYVTGDPERLISLVHLGVKGPITVNGKTYGALAMLPYGNGAPITNDGEFASLLTFIRNEWGNEASPITAEQVAFTRAKLQARAEAGEQWTEAELKAFAPSPDFPKLPDAEEEKGDESAPTPASEDAEEA